MLHLKFRRELYTAYTVIYFDYFDILQDSDGTYVQQSIACQVTNLRAKTNDGGKSDGLERDSDFTGAFKAVDLECSMHRVPYNPTATGRLECHSTKAQALCIST